MVMMPVCLLSMFFNHILKFFFLYIIMAMVNNQMKDEIQKERSHDFLCALRWNSKKNKAISGYCFSNTLMHTISQFVPNNAKSI